jgi:3-oxoacyl-[acyl-carrier-protein] synthase II
MVDERIVITGIGVISPIGNDRASFWRGCLEGRSGAIRLDHPWVTETGLSTQIACTVRGFDPEAAGVPRKQIGLLDRIGWWSLVCAHEALVDAGFELTQSPHNRLQLDVGGVDPGRLATMVGTGIGGLNTLELSHATWREARRKNPIKRYMLPMIMPNGAAGQVAIRFGAQGECKAICTACAAGTMALGDAWRVLKSGDADVVLAGGAEAFAADEDAFGLMGFDRLRTMSQRNDEPERASRPFDKERDGFVLAEGAAILVLERETHAKARGVTGYAAVTGYASNCDASSMMQLDATGESIVALARNALAAAGLGPSDVDHVNAHGTSTVLNDKTESLAFRKLLEDRIDRVSVTGLKSMTGHAIAASGAMETAALAMSLREGVLTPTINYEFPDPECDVNLIANEPREEPIGVALKLSYGFGGHNACLVLNSV